MTHTMELDAKRVLKQFGPRPELGKAMPCLPKKRVTVGLRWSLPKQAYVPDDDVLVARRVALQHVAGNTWRVLCEEEAHWPAVKAWLRINCA